jgi:hypothetical protein
MLRLEKIKMPSSQKEQQQKEGATKQGQTRNP